MAVPNRAALINRLTKVLKKQYKPFKGPELSVMDTIMFASCLENSFPHAAQSAFDHLKAVSFDLNELRVTTVAELAELLNGLPHPSRAANNLKQLLQSIFESQYSFDLEHIRKQKLGQAVTQIQKYKGSTPFIVGYVTQNALGGHAIPIDRGTLECLYIVGIIDEKEKEKWITPGLERAISKNRGIEFGSLLHQLGAELSARPFGPEIRALLLEINPDCKDRLPKRSTKKKTKEEPVPQPPVAQETTKPAKAVAKKAKVDVAEPKRKTAGKPTSQSVAKSAAKKAKPTESKKLKPKSPTPPPKKRSKPVTKQSAGAKKKTKVSKTITRRKPK